MFLKNFIFSTTRWLSWGYPGGRVSKIGFNFQHGGYGDSFRFLK
jgi:hypothetical protein